MERFLSPKEREYIQLLEQGKTWSEITQTLKISPQRLSQIRRSIGDKLGYTVPVVSNKETVAALLWSYFRREALSTYGPSPSGTGFVDLTESEFRWHVLQALS